MIGLGVVLGPKFSSPGVLKEIVATLALVERSGLMVVVIVVVGVVVVVIVVVVGVVVVAVVTIVLVIVPQNLVIWSLAQLLNFAVSNIPRFRTQEPSN